MNGFRKIDFNEVGWRTTVFGEIRTVLRDAMKMKGRASECAGLARTIFCLELCVMAPFRTRYAPKSRRHAHPCHYSRAIDACRVTVTPKATPAALETQIAAVFARELSGKDECGSFGVRGRFENSCAKDVQV